MPMQIIGSGTRMDDVTIAKVTTEGHLWVAGSISSMPTVSVTPTGSQEIFTSTGSVEVFGTLATTPGSESVVTAGSIQTYDPIGIGSVHLVPGSLEVFQTTASDMQVSGIVTISGIFHDIIGSTSVQQDTIPWITSGTSTVAGSIYTTGSLRVANLYEGSIVYQGTSPWVTSGTSTISGLISVSGVFHDIIGSVSVQQDSVPWITSGTATVSGIFHDVIGSVYVSQVVPGTAATNLGKAEDTAHSTGDVGVMALGVRKDVLDTTVSADGEYAPFLFSDHGGLHTEPQHIVTLNTFEATTGWSVLGDDTVNLATTVNHVCRTLALEFDKVDGSDDTAVAGIDRTITSIDICKFLEAGGFALVPFYISSTANVDYIFIRLGTDDSNYNEYRIDNDDDIFTAGWNLGRIGLNIPATYIGNGISTAAVTYLSVGVSFDDEANELADIAFDEVTLNSGMQTTSDITAQITSTVASPNVIVRAWGNAVDTNAGNVSANTLRTVLATDQARLAGSIVNMPIVGISGTVIGVSGIVNQGTDPWSISGTVRTDILTDPVPISGAVNQGTDPWIITGSVYQVSSPGSIEVHGTLATSPGSESVITAGSVEVYQGTITDLNATVSGTVSANILTDPVPISGIVNLGTQWGGVGSVVISGTVPVTATVTVGSESVITAGSVEVYQGTITDLNASVSGTVSANILTDPVPISGIVNQGTDPWVISGAISNLDEVVVTVGSEAVVTAGSIQIYDPIGIGSVHLVPGSLEVYQTTASDMQISGTLDVDIITDPVPVSGIVNIGLGSVRVTNASFGSEVYMPAGSVIITDIQSPTGSLEVFQTTNADMQVQATQETSPWVVSGTATISGVITIDTDPLPISGIVNQGTDPWAVSGTATISAGANSIFGISGTVVGVSGIVNIGTDPVPISGVVNVGSIVGSIAVTNFAALGSKVTIPAGSVIITNELTIGEVGSPSFKQAGATGSSGYTEVWKIGGTGSRLEIHGWKISTNIKGYMQLYRSGTIPTRIANYYLDYASGATIEKTFSTPIIPGGANIHAGFGTEVAGSTDVTIYGREVK